MQALGLPKCFWPLKTVVPYFFFSSFFPRVPVLEKGGFRDLGIPAFDSSLCL